MISLIWNVSVLLKRYLRTYMPTNIALDLLRTPRRLRWAVPVALLLFFGYLLAASVATTLLAGGAPGWLNLLVLMFIWNAMKFASLGLVAPGLLVKRRGGLFAARLHPRVRLLGQNRR